MADTGLTEPSDALTQRLDAIARSQPMPPTQQQPASNPAYDFYQDSWEQTQGTIDRLSQAHRDGYGAISNKLKGLGVLTGQVDYEQYLNDEKATLNSAALQKDQMLSERYIPYVTDVMVPMAEAMPYMEVTMGSVAAGAGIGGAAGLATGPAALPASIVGTLFGSTGLPWATTAAMDAGDIYIELRKKGASHEVARNLAIPAGIASGATWLLNTNAWTATFSGAFKKEAVKHLAAGVINPMTAKYLALAGVGGAAAAGAKASRDLAQVVASNFDDKVSGSVDWVRDLSEAYGSGALTSLVAGIAIDKAGNLAGSLAKAVSELRNKIAGFKQYRLPLARGSLYLLIQLNRQRLPPRRLEQKLQSQPNPLRLLS